MLSEIVASIPVEIWFLCWQRLQRAELKALSRSCHLFRDISLPLLFANLTHKFGCPTACRLYWELSAVAMLRSSMNIKRLVASPKLAALPRRWQISKIGSFNTVPAVFDDTYTLVGVSRGLYQDSILLGLSAFIGLRAIEVNGIDLGADFLIALSKLPALESLICRGTSFSCHSITPRLSLREFIIVDSDHPANNIVSNNSLERLIIHNPSNLPIFLRTLSNQDPYQHLSHLSLSDTKSIFMEAGVQAIFDFLGFCPQLRSLQFVLSAYARGRSHECFTSNVVGACLLPVSVIPHLRYFSGPGHLAQAIIPGRPVQGVSIIGQGEELNSQEIILILKSLSQSTLPILCLHLPFMQLDPLIIASIREHFPFLKSLRLPLNTPSNWGFRLPLAYGTSGFWVNFPYSHAGSAFMESLCTNKIPLPSGIQAIEIVGIGQAFTNLQYHYYLTEISALYPSLEIVILGTKRWIKHRDGRWVEVERDDDRLSQFLGEWWLI